MGVGMGGGGDKMPIRRPSGASQMTTDSKTTSATTGRSASIVLLDERRLEMLIQPRLYAGELLDLVASHCQVTMA